MSRGRLRVHLGAAPGVGKTYAMLNEGRRRQSHGVDVVVGYVETHGRAETAAQIGDLEVVPRQRLVYRGVELEEMDLDAVLARRPELALIDELAHTNVPGSRNEKRWQDVEELLDAGIDVTTTVNIQHLESMNDVVEQITGVHQHETVPDAVVRAADQLELSDLTAEALRRRLTEGYVYRADKVEEALANYFRPGNLDALRELALLWTADRVDEALMRYRSEHGIDDTWETRERVVVALTGAPSGDQLIRRAARMAQRGHAQLLGVHVRSTDGLRSTPGSLLDRHRLLLEALGGQLHDVVADDPAQALVDFARSENATQLVLGASLRSRWTELTRGSVINEVLRRSGSIDVHVISHEPDEAPEAGGRRRPARRPGGLPLSRFVAGWVLALGGAPLTALALANLRPTLDQGSQFLAFHVVVLASAAIGGVWPAVAAALLAAALLNWFFTEPYYSWTVADPESVIALFIFAIVGVAVGVLVTAFAHRTAEARRARHEAEALGAAAVGLVGETDPIPVLLERVRTMLQLESTAYAPAGGEPPLRSGAPQVGPSDHEVSLAGGSLLLWGTVRPGDRRVLDAFVTQLSAALERQQLAATAHHAEQLEATDALRTAVLRAVSHDLRTPLASIKASITSLLQGDIDWDEADRKEFMRTIDEETDRLDHLVANLLDASRLEAGAIHPHLRATAVEEVVPATLGSISSLAVTVELDIPESLPLVQCDPGLLERSLANVVMNAAQHSPLGSTVRIEARARGHVVEIAVIDHGPGVAPDQREEIFRPFQRPNDQASGVGLGLSVARGMVEAMGGSVRATDAPSGGLAMVISVPTVDDEP
jgi:two-component system, OmpR family, sensor histidine kinase KdpD